MNKFMYTYVKGEVLCIIVFQMFLGVLICVPLVTLPQRQTILDIFTADFFSRFCCGEIGQF